MKKQFSVTKLLAIIGISLLILNSAILNCAYAGPTSSTYELSEYGFGGGGTANSDSTSYSMFGILGESEGQPLSSSTYTLNGGLTFMITANVPTAPTFTNPSNNYDRLKFIIATSNNPTDTTYAIAISTDNFVTTRYIQDDDTIGSTLGSEDWQTYTNWGGASGEYVTGLIPGTTYKIKVKAQQGKYTETGWGPTSSASTVQPSLTFGIDSGSVTFSNLYSGNSWTDSSKSTVLTTSTNAYNGYSVYAHVTAPLTYGVNTIANYASANSSPSTWSGNGFGYTTDDSSLTGGTANRFTNGGAKYAGFTTSNSGDPVADHTGPILTEISSEQFNIGYRVTASATQKSGTYSTTVIYVVIPSY